MLPVDNRPHVCVSPPSDYYVITHHMYASVRTARRVMCQWRGECFIIPVPIDRTGQTYRTLAVMLDHNYCMISQTSHMVWYGSNGGMVVIGCAELVITHVFCPLYKSNDETRNAWERYDLCITSNRFRHQPLYHSYDTDLMIQLFIHWGRSFV